MNTIYQSIVQRKSRLKGSKIREYKNSQHCFVTFWDDVSRFSPCVKNLSRNKNIQKVVARSRARIYFEKQLSWTRNKCFCCATGWSLKVKNAKTSSQNFQLNNVTRQVDCFCISYFAALKSKMGSALWRSSLELPLIICAFPHRCSVLEKQI